MAVSTDPNTLSQAASCYSCIPAGHQNEVIIYLLNEILGTGLMVQQLIDASKCMKCIPGSEQQDVITYLLCQIANGGGGTCTPQSGSGSPVGSNTPDFIGQLYHDTNADTYYRSTGLTSADWSVISGGTCNIVTTPAGMDGLLGTFTYDDIPGITKIVFNATTTNAGFDIEFLGDLVEMDFPNLVSIDPTNTQGGYFYCSGNSNLTTLSFPVLSNAWSFNCNANAITALSLPSLVTVGDALVFNGNPIAAVNLPLLSSVGDSLNGYSTSIATLSLPALATVGGNFNCSGNGLLTSVSLPALVSASGNLFDLHNCGALVTLDVSSWVPQGGKTTNLSGCAFDAASVEGVLRRFVLAGVATGTLDISGGTSAGVASLNAQGQADAATLSGILTINP